MPSTSRKVKLYGERNTGTNYLEKLIRRNLDLELLSGVEPGWVMFLHRCYRRHELIRDLYFNLFFRSHLAWKHSFADPDRLEQVGCRKREVLFVTTTKNPYSWLLSLHRKPYLQHMPENPDFLAFLRRPWHAVGRDGDLRLYRSPVDLWNRKNASYARLAEALPTVQVRYEDLVCDPAEVVASIRRVSGCTDPGDTFENVTTSTKDNRKDYDFYRDYYLNDRWRDSLSMESIEEINSRLDPSVAGHYGYEFLTAP